jgi:carboxyl-terminal processing protease
LIGLSCFAAFFLSVAWMFLPWPAVVNPCEGRDGVPKSASVALDDSLLTASDESRPVETACKLIYQDKFDAAGELIQRRLGVSLSSIDAGQAGEDAQPQSALYGLAQIVQEYKGIGRRRQLDREAAYKEQLSELEKFRAETDANDVNDVILGDVNDVNDIVAALSVIAKASEFANEAQKEQLLSDAFVKEVLQEAIDKAAEFESKGEWLEAYANCYPWLQAIDPNNEAYSDYAQQLLDKATIAAAFQDNPCETREERFKGVKEGIFVRAINALSLDYVSHIDYGQMATKAIERCKLLAEVLDTRHSILDENQESRIKNQESAWLVALTALLDEVKSASGEPTKFGKAEFINVFEKVLKLNETTVDLPGPVLIAQFAEASLSTLDPYTVIVWPRQVQDFEKMMTNKFTGIGIEISKPKGLLTVASLLLDTPAFNSGLLDAGDVIEAVNGVETKDMTLTCAVHKITGPAGTKVTLTIKRPSEDKTIEDKVFDMTLTRAKIVVPTIRGWQRTEAGKWLYMIDDRSKIGYVRIYHSFSERTAADLEKALLELEKEGLRGLILDLRFNSGGLLDSAVAVTDKFLKEGLIVRTQPGFSRRPAYKPAHKRKTHPDYPLVVLINSNSASASEIVAGALADKKHKRAVLVGTRTHGKGSVQGVTSYPGGGAQLKYTMAYYHLPSGQKVESRDATRKEDRNDWGVGPNIEIKLKTDELRKMIDVQRDNDVLVKTDHDNARGELKKHTIEETLAADPQLAVGLLVVKSKLIETQYAKSKI